jgi:hypothetical protein
MGAKLGDWLVALDDFRNLAHLRSRIMGDLRRNTMKHTALSVLLAAAVLIPLAIYAQP